MHFWGDQWFREHGDHLYEAIKYVEKNLRKHGIWVAGKEKYGTYRDEYLRFWDGTLYHLLFRGRMYVGPYNHSRVEWIARLQDWFHEFIYWRIDQGWTREMMKEEDPEKRQALIRKRFIGADGTWSSKGFQSLVMQSRWYKRYIEKKKECYNRVFQEACKKWPDVIDELICDTDGFSMIRPCKWGDIDGKKIHDKYWMPISKRIEIENAEE